MITFIGYLAALLTTLSVVPQLVKTIRTRDVRGISLPSWIMVTCGIALWFCYGLAIKAGPVIVSNGVSLALDVTLIILTLRWRHRIHEHIPPHKSTPSPGKTS